MLSVPHGSRNYSKAMTDAVRSVYCLTQWCYNANNNQKQFILPLCLLFSCWPLHLNSALKTELWIFSWSLLQCLSALQKKFQFRKISCSDIILQHLMERCQEVSQVLTAERLESEIWDLAPFSSKWKCACFTVAGSTQVVCIPLFGFCNLFQSLCCSSANHPVCKQHCARYVSSITSPHCSPFSLSPRLVPKFSCSPITFLDAFSITIFSRQSASDLSASCWCVPSTPGLTRGHFPAPSSDQLLFGLICGSCCSASIRILAACWRIEYSLKATEEKPGACCL